MEFRLIIEVSNPSKDIPSIHLNDRDWQLSDPIPLHDNATITDFTCISYVWGTGRMPDPFHEGKFMSDNTLPALSTAIKHFDSSVQTSNSTASPAFWVDALCIPYTEEERLPTLASMGYIYSRAASVVTILQAKHHELMQVMQDRKRSATVDPVILLTLENDDWVKSVWTYQEVVNSSALYFLCDDAAIDGSDFLSFLGHVMDRYQTMHQIDSIEMSQRFPKLDAFLELLADWLTAGSTERSALRVLCQNKYRANLEPKNYFYAAIGAIKSGPCTWNTSLSIEQLAGEFLEICAAKNDYSFIYCSNPRQRVPEREWCPQLGMLQPILVWHSFGGLQHGTGDSQTAHFDKHGFWLHDMFEVTLTARLGDSGRRYLNAWLERQQPTCDEDTDPDLANDMFEALRKMAYTGSSQPLFTSFGMVFPQRCISEEGKVIVYVAAGVRWTFGAAALLRVTENDKTEYVPGVFTGEVALEHARDVLLGPGDFPAPKTA